jgi:hypothetical protein
MSKILAESIKVAIFKGDQQILNISFLHFQDFWVKSQSLMFRRVLPWQQLITFLAHLWLAIAMTWCPSSSISKARFVTARAISMKLGVRIPLGNTPRAFFYFRDFTYFVASRWQS